MSDAKEWEERIIKLNDQRLLLLSLKMNAFQMHELRRAAKDNLGMERVNIFLEPIKEEMREIENEIWRLREVSDA